jgi:hypothetical protein
MGNDETVAAGHVRFLILSESLVLPDEGEPILE